MIENMSPEVLIYIQTVKKFFNTNEESKRYFLDNGDEEIFFKYLEEIAQKNFDKNGEPMLSEVQFELLRKTTKVISIAKKEYPQEEKNNIFMDVTGFEPVCLN